MLLMRLHTQSQFLIVAHRGASHDAPENTIPAFELAWKQGSDAIEGDFHLTRDGKIVCIHNDTTKEVAGTELVVKNVTLHELKQLDVGAWFGRRWKGTTIPTITEVFQTMPETKTIFIEIKCGHEILPKLFEVFKASGLSKEQVVIISFDALVIYHVKQYYPVMKALLVFDFETEQRYDISRPSVEDVLKTLRFTQADGLSTKAHNLVDETFVRRIFDEGYEYHVWTINKAITAKKFIRMGVMSITTNIPGYLRKKLQK